MACQCVSCGRNVVAPLCMACHRATISMSNMPAYVPPAPAAVPAPAPRPLPPRRVRPPRRRLRKAYMISLGRGWWRAVDRYGQRSKPFMRNNDAVVGFIEYPNYRARNL